MSRQRIIQALKPRTSLNTPTLGACFMLHEGTGTTVSDEWGVAADLTVSGTTTGIWANSGWLTCSGDNYMRGPNVSGTLFDIMRLDDIEGKQVLIAADLHITSDPTADEYLFGAGQINISAIGGWGLKINTSGALVLRYRAPGDSSVTALTAFGDITADMTGRVQVMLELDGNSDSSNIVANCYVNGSLLGSGSFPKSTLIGSVTDNGTQYFATAFGAYPNYGTANNPLASGRRLERCIAWKGDYETGLAASIANELTQIVSEPPIGLSGK